MLSKYRYYAKNLVSINHQSHWVPTECLPSAHRVSADTRRAFGGTQRALRQSLRGTRQDSWCSRMSSSQGLPQKKPTKNLKKTLKSVWRPRILCVGEWQRSYEPSKWTWELRIVIPWLVLSTNSTYQANGNSLPSGEGESFLEDLRWGWFFKRVNFFWSQTNDEIRLLEQV